MNRAECEYLIVVTFKDSHAAYRCKRCGHERRSRHLPNQLHRICDTDNPPQSLVPSPPYQEEPPHPFGLGDRVSQALSLIGITDDRVSAWLGRPCGCAERRERLNQLGQWVARVLSGKTDQAKEHLEDLLRSEP